MSSWSSRWLVGTAVVVAALVIASIAVGIGAGGESLPEDSPEGVVQRYLLSLEDDDFRAAYDYLADDLKETCGLRQFRDGARRAAERGGRALLEDAEEIDGRTVVRVRLTTISTDAPIFTPVESSYTETYALERRDGAWRITEPPWPLYHCEAKTTPTPAPVKPTPTEDQA